MTVRNTDFRVFLASSFLFFLGGCVERGATPDAEPRNFNPPAAVRSGSAGDDSTSGPERIDVLGLQRSLGLDGMELGYFEKGFDSCAAGYGYRAGGDCKNLKFVVVRFQLQCRNSEGTEQNSDYQTTPVGAADIKWTLGGQKGVARTDGSGKSEIVAIAPKSPREAKLRLTRSNDFLLITAEDARRIVAPKSWCDQP